MRQKSQGLGFTLSQHSGWLGYKDEDGYDLCTYKSYSLTVGDMCIDMYSDEYEKCCEQEIKWKKDMEGLSGALRGQRGSGLQ